MNHITGKVVVITDAGSMLGEAAARYLSEQGAIVALGSGKLHRIRELAHELAWDGGRAIAVQADLAHKAQVKELVRQAADAFGTVDVLVTCDDDAPQREPTCEIGRARVAPAVGAVLPLMLRQRRGHIVDLSCTSDATSGLRETLQAANIRTTTISVATASTPEGSAEACAASFARALAFAIGQPDGMAVEAIVIGASAGQARSVQ